MYWFQHCKSRLTFSRVDRLEKKGEMEVISDVLLAVEDLMTYRDRRKHKEDY